MDSLPPELLLYIFEFLYPLDVSFPNASSSTSYERSSDLARVCLVSRRINQIATPILYRSIEQAPGRTPLFFKDVLVALCGNPTLKQHVKAIKQRGSYRFISWTAHVSPPEWAMPLSDGMDLLHPDEIYSRLASGEDPFITLLALQSPNLEQLCVDFPKHRFDGGGKLPLLLEKMTAVLAAPLGSPPQFHSLRVLRLDLRFWDHFPINSIYQILLLPQLKDLTLGRWGAVYERDRGASRPDPDHQDSHVLDQPWIWPVRSSPIERLSLLSSRAPAYIIANLVTACKALKRFECGSPARFTGAEFRYNQVSAAVAAHYGSLEELAIGTKEYHPPEDYGEFKYCENLKFLKVLRIPYRVLMKHNHASGLLQRLPPDLEFLILDFPRLDRLSFDFDGILLVLREAVSSGGFSQLKAVEFRLLGVGEQAVAAVPDIHKYRSAFQAGGTRLDMAIAIGNPFDSKH